MQEVTQAELNKAIQDIQAFGVAVKHSGEIGPDRTVYLSVETGAPGFSPFGVIENCMCYPPMPPPHARWFLDAEAHSSVMARLCVELSP